MPFCKTTHLQKKASGMALSIVSHYPDQPALVQAMVDLAVEELNHYKEVMRLLMTRQISPAADRKDPYVTRLNKFVRKDAVFFCSIGYWWAPLSSVAGQSVLPWSPTMSPTLI